MAPKRKPKLVQDNSSLTKKNNNTFNDEIWPVTTNEDFKTHDMILPPGPILKQCSGADIMLAKGATIKPNLTKGKGRFLIILPGLLSLKPKGGKSITDTKIQDDTSLTLSPEPIQDDTSSTSFTQTEDVIPSTTIMVPKHVFAKLSGLSTDTPTLTISIPNMSHPLVLVGRKVESSSRFMMLHCHARKQAVTCKDVVQTVLVFSYPKRENHHANGLASNNTPWKHYGGSIRGTTPGWQHGKQVVVARSTVNMHVDDDTTTTTSHSDSSEDQIKTTTTMVPMKRSKRSNASEKMTYTEDSDDDHSSSARDSEQSVPNKLAKGSAMVDTKTVKLGKPIRKRVAKASATKEKGHEEHAMESQPTRRKLNIVEAASGEDSDEYVEEKAITTLEPKKRARRSTLGKKITYTQESDDDHVDEQDNTNSDNDDSPPPPKKKRATIGTKKAQPVDHQTSKRSTIKPAAVKIAPSKKLKTITSASVKDESITSEPPIKPTRRGSRTTITTPVKENDATELGPATKRGPTKKAAVEKVANPTKTESDIAKVVVSDAIIKPAPRRGVIQTEQFVNDQNRPNTRKPRASQTTKTNQVKKDSKRKAPAKKQGTVKTSARGKSTLVNDKNEEIIVPTAKRRITVESMEVVLQPKQIAPNTIDLMESPPPCSPKTAGSPSPRTKSARRKLQNSIEKAKEDVDDGGVWTMDFR